MQCRAGQCREEAGFELRAPLSVLCVLHQAAPQKSGSSFPPHHPQFVVNSLGGTDMSIVDTDLSKASVATRPLGLLSLLSYLQFPKPGVHGPGPWLGHRDATYRYWCHASTLAQLERRLWPAPCLADFGSWDNSQKSLWPEFICLGVGGV